MSGFEVIRRGTHTLQLRAPSGCLVIVAFNCKERKCAHHRREMDALIAALTGPTSSRTA